MCVARALVFQRYSIPFAAAKDEGRAALREGVAANIAGQQGRQDTKRELLNQYYGTLAKNRSTAPVTSKVVKRTLPRIY